MKRVIQNSPDEYLPTGTEINYFFICPTKLWFFSHNIRMEKGSDDVGIGRLVHETSYSREKKNILIDDKIAVDFIRKGELLVIHEVKKSKKMEYAHELQLQYYLWYLKRIKKICNVSGMLDYPLLKANKRVNLDRETEERIESIIRDVKIIRDLPCPPKAEKRELCKKCAYYEFCMI